MPRTQQDVQVEVLQSPNAPGNALIASAQRLPANVSRIFYRKNAEWQKEAWRFYDTCAELRYGINWIANVISRATLHAARRDGDQIVRAEEGSEASQLLEAIFGGSDGQSQMLKSIGVHISLVGEGYIVGRKPSEKHNETGDDDIWEVVSTEEMRNTGKAWSIERDDGLPPIILEDDDYILRVWRPHPRRSMEADSPIRPLLSTLHEMDMLGRHVMAQITSRLAGNGILFLPSNMQFPSPPVIPNEDGTLPPPLNTAESFMLMLGGAMIAPINDPGDPSALVPIVVTADGEAIDKIKHVTFWSPLDAEAINMRKEAIGRLALGMDLPAEVLLGSADLNHWTGWQIEESSIKVQAEPLLDLIVNAITVGYIRVITDDDADLVAFDTSQLRLRPNRSKEAMELYDRLELSGDSLRRETGFSPDDKPEEEEFKTMLIRKIAGGSATPQQVADALLLLGIAGISGDENTGPTRETRPDPSLEDHPTQGMPDRADEASLHATAEMLVFRALERAGNRLRSLRQTRPPCAAADTYLLLHAKAGDLDKVLEDAWTCIPRVLPRLAEEQRAVVASALDSYTRRLLLEQEEFDRPTMERFLSTTTVRSLV